MTAAPRTVVILTAGVGAGHDGPARELARRLTEAGHHARVVDLVTLAPLGLGRMLRALFHAQLRWAPSSWGAIFRSTDRDRAVPWLVRLLMGTVSARVAAILTAAHGGHPSDVVVGTFPAAGHVVARSRRYGVSTPLVVYLTDPAVHRLWIADGVDLYLSTWPDGAAEVRRLSDGPVAVVSPAVRAAFTAPVRTAVTAPGTTGSGRAAFGLPAGPLVLLCSGSWGVGDVAAAALDVVRSTIYTPVVVCGRNASLRRRIAVLDGVVALGWVQEMAELMRCCDVALLNSGGLTLAECLTVGLPVVHYRPLPGQGEANAHFCEEGGYAAWPRTLGQLGPALDAARSQTGHSLVDADPLLPILQLAGMGLSTKVLPTSRERRRAA